jgi:hypothetical protein
MRRPPSSLVENLRLCWEWMHSLFIFVCGVTLMRCVPFVRGALPDKDTGFISFLLLLLVVQEYRGVAPSVVCSLRGSPLLLLHVISACTGGPCRLIITGR